jgi:hypothetical protein
LPGAARRTPLALRQYTYDAMPEIEKMFDKERKGQAVVVDLDRITGAEV